MTKIDAIEHNFVTLTDEEMMNVDGGLAITATGVIGTLIVTGFGGIGLYLGLK